MDRAVSARQHQLMRVTLERLRNWVLEPFRGKSELALPVAPRAPLDATRIGQWIEGQRTVRWRGPGSAEKIGWVRQVGPSGSDVSVRYNQLYAKAKTGKLRLPSDAKEYTYLLVGGLFTNQYPGYMGSNQKVLKQAGLRVQKVAIDTAAGVATNAGQIRDAVLAATAQGGQVVLIGQSKGGVDISAALALYPDLAAKVRSVITIQAPYGGTPIASDIQTCAELKPVVEGFVGLLNGDQHALTDLSYEAREAFVQAHPYPARVPTVCLASARDSITRKR